MTWTKLIAKIFPFFSNAVDFEEFTGMLEEYLEIYEAPSNIDELTTNILDHLPLNESKRFVVDNRLYTFKKQEYNDTFKLIFADEGSCQGNIPKATCGELESYIIEYVQNSTTFQRKEALHKRIRKEAPQFIIKPSVKPSIKSSMRASLNIFVQDKIFMFTQEFYQYSGEWRDVSFKVRSNATHCKKDDE